MIQNWIYDDCLEKGLVAPVRDVSAMKDSFEIMICEYIFWKILAGRCGWLVVKRAVIIRKALVRICMGSDFLPFLGKNLHNIHEELGSSEEVFL